MIRRTYITTALAVIICVFASAGFAADMSAWAHKMKVTVRGYDRSAPLTNFPDLVVLGPGIAGFSYSQVADAVSAGDLRFQNSNETVLLDCEIEEWNTNGSSYIWVKVPLVQDSNTCYWAYWGNPGGTNPPASRTNGAVWSDFFNGVWHLQQSSGTRVDSTTNDIDGALSGDPSSVSGVVSRATDLDGSGDFVTLGTGADLNFGAGTDFTVELWVKTAGWSSDSVIIANKDWSNGLLRGWLIAGANGGSTWQWNLADQFGTRIDYDPAGPALTDSRWHHLCVVYDRSANATFYVDGRYRDVRAISTFGTLDSGYPTRLGQDGTGLYNPEWTGTIDETRISSEIRSSNWVAATYLAVASNGSFHAYDVVSNSLPFVNNSAGATGVTMTAAWLDGALVTTGDSATEVWVYWGTADGTNKTVWERTNYFGFTSSTSFTHQATGMLSATTYYYRYYASNAAGQTWCWESSPFETLGSDPLINNAGGATAVTATNAVLNGVLTWTGASPTRVYVYWGATDGMSNKSSWQNTNFFGTNALAVPVAFATNIMGLAADQAYFYRFYATNASGDDWCDAPGEFLTDGVSTQYTGDGIVSNRNELMRWRMNRARWHPEAEADRLGLVNSTAGGTPGYDVCEDVSAPNDFGTTTNQWLPWLMWMQPLAPNAILQESAYWHARDLTEQYTLMHESPSDNYYTMWDPPWTRNEKDGYTNNLFGNTENIGYGNLWSSGGYPALGMFPRPEYEGYFVDGTAPDRGHRKAILNSDAREVGSASYILHTYGPPYYTEEWAVHDLGERVTEDVPHRHFFTGTTFNDTGPANGEYDDGEGVGNIEIRLWDGQAQHAWYDESYSSGSFAVPIDGLPDGKVIRVQLCNTGAAGKTLTIPLDATNFRTVAMSPSSCVWYAEYDQPMGRTNVGFRDCRVFPSPLPVLQFAAATSGATEATTSTNLAVTLTPASSATVTFNYRVTGGSATGGGVDYELASGIVTMGIGSTSHQIDLTVSNDAVFEADETLTVLLYNPIGASMGPNSNHTYTIVDDDPWDSDNDGIGDDWELSRFGSLTNADETTDADADGFPDLSEFGADTNPTNSNSLLIVTSLALAGQTNNVVTWQSVTSRVYSLYARTNLMYGQPFTIATNIPGQQTSTSHDAGSSNRYIFFWIETGN